MVPEDQLLVRRLRHGLHPWVLSPLGTSRRFRSRYRRPSTAARRLRLLLLVLPESWAPRPLRQQRQRWRATSSRWTATARRRCQRRRKKASTGPNGRTLRLRLLTSFTTRQDGNPAKPLRGASLTTWRSPGEMRPRGVGGLPSKPNLRRANDMLFVSNMGCATLQSMMNPKQSEDKQR